MTGSGAYSGPLGVLCDANGKAQTDYGINRVYAFAEYQGSGDPTYASLSANASVGSKYTDTLTADAPGHTGETGSMRFLFALTGTSTPAGTVFFGLSVGAAPVTLNPLSTTGNTTFLESDSVALTFGTGKSFSVTLNASATVGGSDSELIQAESDYFHTATLQNLTFFDSDGNRLSNVSATSSSGTSYTVLAAAPEPDSLAFLSMTALPVVGMVRRRKV